MDSLCLQPLFLRILYFCGVFFRVICFIVPIILIIKLIMDVYKQILNPDNKDFKGKVTTRLVASVVIFLVPTIISLLFSFIENVIGTNSYNDLAVCREFANPEYINILEDDIKQKEIEIYIDERNSNLSAYEKKVEAVRNYIANNHTNNTNTNNNANSNSNNTQTDIINSSGKLQAKKYSNWNYYLYSPDSAKSTSKKPLVIFLHGSGEAGSNISKLENYGFAKYIKQGKNYDAYILIPQLLGDKWDTSSNRNTIMELIKKTINENYVDTSRISIIGFSLGTVAVPNLLKENPNYFSAVVLIALCGSGDSRSNYFKNIPTRIYAGSEDTSMGNSTSTKSFVSALKKINSDVEFTVYPGKGHNVVDTALSDGTVLNWMISKKR